MLNVPIYLHPTIPPKPVVDALYDGFSPVVSWTFAAAGWGWHIETSVHLIRMMLGGVFDRYPKLQVVIGHLGEGIPFMLPRLNRLLPQGMTKLGRPLGGYLRENVNTPFGLQFSCNVSRPDARSRCRANHVLRRLSVRIDDGGTLIP